MKYICNIDKELNEDFIAEMSRFFDLDIHLVRLLYSRGINTQEKMKHYLSPSISDLHDPFLFENMQAVVEKIQTHIENDDKILIFGDYDVDGISASAILIQYFNSIGVKVTNYMPNRYEDGYGLSVSTLDKIFMKDTPDLIITVDCGITSLEEVNYIK